MPASNIGHQLSIQPDARGPRRTKRRAVFARSPHRRVAVSVAAAAALCIGPAPSEGQHTQSAPATDSAAQASPLKPPPAAPATDSAAQASPVAPLHTGGVSVSPRTAITVRLNTGIDSGHLKNGDTVHATLARPVALSPRGSLPAGTPAALSVIETLPAGRISAAGEFSLQAVRVGSVSIFTDTLTYRGKPGHKDLPDSAPAVGTDAGLPAGAELTFHVLPPAAPAAGPPQAQSTVPGSVNGIAAGSPPPPGSSSAPQQTQPGNTGNKVSGTARQVTPGANTPQPAQNSGQTSTAPNQPAPPESTNPASSTQPR